MKEKIIELIKFLFIGGIMTMLSMVLYWFFIEICNINYLFSNIISYSISVIISYFLNVFFTFKEKIKDNKEQMKKLLSFFMMKLLMLGLDTSLLFILVNNLGINKYLSKIILTIVLTLLSYPLTRIIIKYKKKVKKI